MREEDCNKGGTHFGGIKKENRRDKGVPSEDGRGDVVDSEVADSCRGSKELEEVGFDSETIFRSPSRILSIGDNSSKISRQHISQ